LIAEEVEKANPDLVVRDKEGKPYRVRYDQVNAILPNEFLKSTAPLSKSSAKSNTNTKRLTSLSRN
jgi:hypothetical protein